MAVRGNNQDGILLRMAGPIGKRRIYISVLIVGVLCSVLWAAVVIVPPGLIQELNHFGYDFMLRMASQGPPESSVVIVDIDDASLEQFGQWPWPRYLLARVLDRIRLAGARSVGVDVLLAEPDRMSPRRLQTSYHNDLKIDVDLTGVPDEYRDFDALLAKTLAEPEFVAGIWFAFDNEQGRDTGCPPHSLNVIVRREPGAPEVLPVPTALAALCPTEPLAEAVSAVGFLNALPDTDGRVRRMPMVVAHGDSLYPSLALATVMRAIQASQLVVTVSAAGVESVRADTVSIPTDSRGNMLLPFTGTAGQFRYVSAADILTGDMPEGAFKNSVVLVGSSAPGLMDVHPTPFERRCPGVEIHAVAADAMLRSTYLLSPSWVSGLQVLLSVAAGLAVTLGVARFRLSRCAAACVAVALLLWFGAAWLLARHGLYISPMPAITAIAGSFVLLAVLRFRLEEKEALRSAEELAAAQNYAICGFTSLAETRDPETGRHIQRTQHFIKVLAQKLAGHARFRKHLTPDNIEMLFKCAPLHDIGKVGVRDHVLLKPGKTG